MPPITNLSFETQGTNPGDAASWTRTATAPFHFESFETPLYVSRFEGFEMGWGADDFIDELVVPTTAAVFEFGTIPALGVITPYENFERSWRLPNSHGLAQSGISHPFGNAAPFALSNGETLHFKINGSSVSVTFLTGDFADITHATAIEVVHKINLEIGLANITDGFAFADSFGRVFITTTETNGPHLIEGGAFGNSASVESKVGNVVTLDGFPDLDESFVGVNVTFTGAASGGNNVTAPIASVTNTGPGQWSMTIVNAAGVAPDANNGSIAWIIASRTSPGASIEIVSGTSLAPLGFVVGVYEGGVDPEHPGNETAIFMFDSSVSAIFSVAEYPPIGVPFEGFERGAGTGPVPWPNGFFTAFSQVPSVAAVFELHPFENFESGWDDNEHYRFFYSFLITDNDQCLFAPLGGGFEPFESVKADQTISPDFTTSKIRAVGHGFANGDKVTFYAGTTPQGNFGLVPTGLNPLVTYFVINKTTNDFQVSLTSGGAAVTFTDNGTAPCFVKADPAIYWTITDVGI